VWLPALPIQTFTAASKLKIEKGSLLSISQLKLYSSLLMVSSRDLNSIEVLIREGRLTKSKLSKGFYEILEDFYMPELLMENKCRRKNCLQIPVKLDDIPSSLWRGVIGIEDYRFLEHYGVDPKSIARAFISNVKSFKFSQGGSTITQQLVKNLFLTREKTIMRKIKEAIISFYIELTYSKEEIIQSYLNNVYWGSNDGIEIRGVFAASLYYFNKGPPELTELESSILISLLKGPAFYSPKNHLDRLKKRVDIVSRKLEELKFIINKKKKVWSSRDWEGWKKSLDANETMGSVYFLLNKTDVTSSFLSSYEKMVIELEAFRVLIHFKKLNPQAQLNYFGILSSFKENTSPYIFSSNTKSLRGKKFQAGSIIKPLIYGLILNKGDLDKYVLTAPITLELKSGSWKPRDAKKQKKSEVKIRFAIQKSLNIPLVRLASSFDLDQLEEKMGVYFNDLKSPLKEYPSQLLGAIELSPFDLVRMYRLFFSDVCDLNFNKKELFEALSQPGVTTTARRAGYLRQSTFFGKTGTSNNGYDNWYLFFDGETIGVVWLGHIGRRDIGKLKISGSSSSFEILKGFLMGRGKRMRSLLCPD